MIILARNLKAGMVVVDNDGGKTVVVSTVDTRRCRNHVHINERACYDAGAQLEVRE